MTDGRQVPTQRTLSEYNPRENSFDTIRLIAAVLVILSHAFPLTGTAEPLETLSGGQASIGHLAVSIFFLISGYLIPASLDRGTLSRFASKRAFRILPGLTAAVLLCAFVLGPLATSLAMGEYLADPLTWKFLGNIVFLPVGYSLPGVFTDHPLTAVNGSLWSLKFEVACYVAVPVLFAFGSTRIAAVAVAWLASFVLSAAIPEDAGGALYYIGTLSGLFRFFGGGMLVYLLSGHIVMRKDWAIMGLAACVLAVFTPVFVPVVATAGAYAVIYFAHNAPYVFRMATARGDISYGVYVYAFPIQQSLVPLSLGLTIGGTGTAWLTNVFIALPLTLVAGVLSWVAIERPFIGKGQGVRRESKAAD